MTFWSTDSLKLKTDSCWHYWLIRGLFNNLLPVPHCKDVCSLPGMLMAVPPAIPRPDVCAIGKTIGLVVLVILSGQSWIKVSKWCENHKDLTRIPGIIFYGSGILLVSIFQNLWGCILHVLYPGSLLHAYVPIPFLKRFWSSTDMWDYAETEMRSFSSKKNANKKLGALSS